MVATSIPACGNGLGSMVITEERVGQPTGPNAAMYFTVTNGGQADRLIGAESAAADSIEIHESTTGEDGMIGMRRLDGLDVAANETIVLAPGRYHLMLIGVDRLDVGEAIDVTLTWEKAGNMVVETEVVEPSGTMGEPD